MKIDKMFFNGNIITLDNSNTIVDSLALNSGKIVKLGKKDDLMKLVDEDTQLIDLEGKTMIPGFIDSHSHFYSTGLVEVTMADLNAPPVGNVKSIEDIKAVLKEYIKDLPEGKLVKGFGYDDTSLKEKRRVTREDLDSVSRKHPIIIKHITGHIHSANTLGLELLEIDEDTVSPEGSVYVRDENNKLTGVIEEDIERINRILTKITKEEVKDGIKVANQIYAKSGVTTANSGMTDDPAEVELIKELQDKGQVKVRLVLNRAASAYENFEKFNKYDDRLYKGSIKNFHDGSIQGYTGYLSQPYYIQPQGEEDYRGYPAQSKEALFQLVEKYHRLGEQVLIHGNGDAAIEDIIQAFISAQEEYPREDPRHVVIHSQMVREDQLDKMKEHGILPSFFMLHTYYWGDRHRDIFMGPERAARMSPLKSALDRDMIFTTHCDTPVVPQEPMRSIWSSVTRLSFNGDIIGPEQRINVIDALRAYTINSAYQYKLEDSLGSIEVGKFADLVVLSEDISQIPSEELKDIEVLETIVNGETIYKA